MAEDAGWKPMLIRSTRRKAAAGLPHSKSPHKRNPTKGSGGEGGGVGEGGVEAEVGTVEKGGEFGEAEGEAFG